MVFSSITFLYYFLPVFLILYFGASTICKDVRIKNGILLIFSLFFYSWGEPVYILLMLGVISVTWLVGRCLEKKNEKWILQAAVGVFLLLLCCFKFPFMQNVLGVTMPLGISFYMFQSISYLVDVHKKRITAQKSLLKLSVYVSMFPQLVAGPIVRYQDIEGELDERYADVSEIWDGIRRFVIGLAKKVLLANQFGELCAIFKISEDKSILFCWVYAISLILQYYYDFSGYSDMAIGLGKILGFHFPENFYYPYRSRSITEFWRRWHMSLGSWFRDYVYIPLGGSRVSRGKHIRNIIIVWCLTGLWHGGTVNFLLWGGFFAGILLLEKFVYGKYLENHRWISHGYVLLCVIISFVIFDNESLLILGQTLAGMFAGANLPVVSMESIYYLRSYGLLLLLGILGTSGLPVKWARYTANKRPGWMELLFVIGAWLLVTAYLVDGTFNPFLYFRF